MRLGRRDHADDQRRIASRWRSKAILLLVGTRILGAEDLADQSRRLVLAFPFEDHEAPGRELAMVGHARPDGQQIFQLIGDWGPARSGIAAAPSGAALEQGERIGHETSGREEQPAQHSAARRADCLSELVASP